MAVTNGTFDNTFIEGFAIAMSDRIVTDVLLKASDNFAADDIGDKDHELTKGVLTRVRGTLVRQRVTNAVPKAIITAPECYSSLLEDTHLENFFAFQQTDAITGGRLVNIGGLNIIESGLIGMEQVPGKPMGVPKLVSPDTNAGAFKNIVLTPQSVILAVRSLPPVGPGAISVIIKDEQTGLSFRMGTQYNADLGAIHFFCDMLYGVASLRGGDIGLNVIAKGQPE
jgi:hypothetical protein